MDEQRAGASSVGQPAARRGARPAAAGGRDLPLNAAAAAAAAGASPRLPAAWLVQALPLQQQVARQPCFKLAAEGTGRAQLLARLLAGAAAARLRCRFELRQHLAAVRLQGPAKLAVAQCMQNLGND